MHWLVATAVVNPASADRPLVIITSEASTSREQALSSDTTFWLVVVGSAFTVAVAFAAFFVRTAQNEIDKRTNALSEARASLAAFVSRNVHRRAEWTFIGFTSYRGCSDVLGRSRLLDFAEGASPDQAAALVSTVASVGFAAVLANGGDIDRLVGDGFIAWFEGPTRHLNAWKAADQILAELSPRALPRGVGLGLHDGIVVEAEIGVGSAKMPRSLAPRSI